MEIIHDELLNDYNSCCPLKTKYYVSSKDNMKLWNNNSIKAKMEKKVTLFSFI